METMKKRVCLCIDEARFEALRIEAIKAKTSASQIVDSLVADWLKAREANRDKNPRE